MFSISTAVFGATLEGAAAAVDIERHLRSALNIGSGSGRIRTYFHCAMAAPPIPEVFRALEAKDAGLLVKAASKHPREALLPFLPAMTRLAVREVGRLPVAAGPCP